MFDVLYNRRIDTLVNEFALEILKKKYLSFFIGTTYFIILLEFVLEIIMPVLQKKISILSM